MASQEEKNELKRQLFRLIDSYLVENIDLALVLIKNSDFLHHACKVRYYPLLRRLDPSLGRGFTLLKKAVVELQNPQNHAFCFDWLNYYLDLGELEAVAHLAEPILRSKPFSNIKSLKALRLLEKRLQGHPNLIAACNDAIQTLMTKHPQAQSITDAAVLQEWLNEPNFPEDLIKEIKLHTQSIDLHIPPDTRILRLVTQFYLSDPKFYTAFFPIFEQWTQLEGITFYRVPLVPFPAFIARQHSLKSLYLTSCQLSELPDELDQLTELNSLKLEGNAFREIPPVLQRLPKLSWLNLDENPLRVIPDWISNLKALRNLQLDQTKLERLPAALFQLPSLTSVYVYNNRIQSIEVPEEVSDCKLSWVGVHKNPLKQFPTGLLRLPLLKHLNLSNCELEEVPETIGDCKTLDWLDVADNRIRRIPERIGELQQLDWLLLGNNPITSLPDSIGKLTNLRGLSVRESAIRQVPESIRHLQNLEHFDLRRTPITEEQGKQLQEWLPGCEVLVGKW